MYLHLMGNFTIRKTCVDAAILDGKSRRPQRLNSKLGPMQLPFFPIRRIAPGPYFFSSINKRGTGGPDIVRGMVNRVQVKGLTGFDCY